MASNHTFMNYNSSGLHGRGLQTCSAGSSSCQQWDQTLWYFINKIHVDKDGDGRVTEDELKTGSSKLAGDT